MQAYRTGTVVLAALALAWAPSVGAQESVGDYRAKLSKWVATRQIISEEKSEWDADRELLRSSRNLLRDQKEGLEAEIAELEASNTSGDEERRELLLRRGEFQRANRSLTERIETMEREVLALAPRLPEPLQRRLELLLVQIPEDPENTDIPLGQRLMNILGVLAQAEKFNSTATFVAETRAVNGDPEHKVSVRTLYWGLGQAIFVDALGETAGIGRPGAAGWEFEDRPELAEDARRLIDIYEGNVDYIDFVPIPVEIE